MQYKVYIGKSETIREDETEHSSDLDTFESTSNLLIEL